MPVAAPPIPVEPEPEPAAPSRRGRRGRPKLLTHQQIVDATLEMLAEGGLAGFAMNKLARRLGASVMTLYTYFASREALLDATAGRIFSGFEPPADDLPWPKAIEAWLRELYRLFERHPIGLGLIKWDGAITPSWLRVWMPLLRILSRAGLSGRELLVASTWVGRVGLALLMARLTTDDEIAATRRVADRDATLSEADRAMLATLSNQAASGQGDPLYDFGIANIIRGLATLIPVEVAPPTKAKRPRRTVSP